MSNKLHYMVILFFCLSSSLMTITSGSPRPPREIHSWVGQAHHQLKKRDNPFAYATDGGHLKILSYLNDAGNYKEFYIDANFLSQLQRSVGRSTIAGTEILVNIEAQNFEKLRRLREKNKEGLPQYLINAINTLTADKTYTRTTVTQKSDPPPTPDHSLVGQALGFLAKQWDSSEYVFKSDAKELATYLTQTSQSSHCNDANFKVNVERALKRMGYVHNYLRDRIAERNTSSAQEALDHNEAFLPVAHVALFQKAIDELKKEEKRYEKLEQLSGKSNKNSQFSEDFEEIPKEIPISPSSLPQELANTQTLSVSPKASRDSGQPHTLNSVLNPKQARPKKPSKNKKKTKYPKQNSSGSDTSLP